VNGRLKVASDFAVVGDRVVRIAVPSPAALEHLDVTVHR
jgi:hypothetical protein